MNFKKAFGLCLFLLAGQRLFAFDLPVEEPHGRDTAYIGIPQYPLNVRLHQINKFQRFSLDNRKDSLPGTRFSPNDIPGVGMGLFYRNYGFFIGLALPSFQQETERRGRSTRLDLQTNVYGARMAFDLYYQRYTGFYLENATDFARRSPDRPYIIRPDIRVYNMGVNAMYVWNWKKFSLRAAYIQSEIQKKNAGSFLISTSAAYYGVNADSALLPSEVRVSGLEDITYQKGNFYSFTVSPGYSYTFVHKEFYFNISLMAGIGPVYRDFSLETGERFSSTRVTLRFQARSAIGWNGPRYFGGISFIQDEYDLPLSAASFRYRLGHLRLFIGYRPNFQMKR